MDITLYNSKREIYRHMDEGDIFEVEDSGLEAHFDEPFFDRHNTQFYALHMSESDCLVQLLWVEDDLMRRYSSYRLKPRCLEPPSEERIGLRDYTLARPGYGGVQSEPTIFPYCSRYLNYPCERVEFELFQIGKYRRVWKEYHAFGPDPTDGGEDRYVFHDQRIVGQATPCWECDECNSILVENGVRWINDSDLAAQNLTVDGSDFSTPFSPKHGAFLTCSPLEDFFNEMLPHVVASFSEGTLSIKGLSRLFKLHPQLLRSVSDRRRFYTTEMISEAHYLMCIRQRRQIPTTRVHWFSILMSLKAVIEPTYAEEMGCALEQFDEHVANSRWNDEGRSCGLQIYGQVDHGFVATVLAMCAKATVPVSLESLPMVGYFYDDPEDDLLADGDVESHPGPVIFWALGSYRQCTTWSTSEEFWAAQTLARTESRPSHDVTEDGDVEKNPGPDVEARLGMALEARVAILRQSVARIIGTFDPSNSNHWAIFSLVADRCSLKFTVVGDDVSFSLNEDGPTNMTMSEFIAEVTRLLESKPDDLD
jgi:hypothetical protein